MKPEEQRVLGILATIFGAIALLGSWIPFINYLSFFHRHRRIYLGDYRPYRQPQKNGKQWPLLEQLCQLLLLYLFFTTQVLYANVYKEFVREFNRSYSEASASMEREEESDLTDDSAYSIPEEEEDDNFTWTQEQFDA